MRTIQRSFWASMVVVSILFTACTATKFTGVWMDETYQGHPAKIMVIAVSNTPATRRLLEDAFVKELKDYETDAIVSYTALPDQLVADKGVINAKAKEVGADTVLITKAVGRKTGTTQSLWAAYPNEYIDTKANMYDVKSGKLIWTASLETWIKDTSSKESQIQAFVKVIVRRLSEQKLVNPVPTVSNIKS
ncbi:MAG TPA: hypothetical protein VMM54_14175 [Nitrospirota bacterium]|nr:hypothetical protein [Nitrospirota bacterium]